MKKQQPKSLPAHANRLADYDLDQLARVPAYVRRGLKVKADRPEIIVTLAGAA